jgi:16S rRNA (uracil1498-N3)-methyltransferase
MKKIKLLINFNKISTNQDFIIKDNDFHYLATVMRAKINDKIEVFNGFDGDFSAKITEIGKKSLKIAIIEKIKEQENSSFVTAAFAPVKNVGIDFFAKKGTEMGVAKFQPIITKNSIVDKINEERFKANIKEACEQCETNFIPEILPILTLEKMLKDDFLQDKILILCDETLHDKNIKTSEILTKIANSRQKNQEIVIFIGPEGGFSQNELEKIRNLPNSHSISLGKRILRADTAFIAALALINEFFS